MEPYYWILGTIFGLMVAFFGFFLVYNAFSVMMTGQCTVDALSEMTNIKIAINGLKAKSPGESSDQISISLGSCTGSILFINREDLLSSNIQISGKLECITDYDGIPYQSFMIFAPNPGIEDTGWQFWKKWGELPKAELKDFLQNFGLVEGMCKPLFSTDDMFDYSDEPTTLDGPGGSGTKKYCVQVKKTGSHKYKINTLNQGVCS